MKNAMRIIFENAGNRDAVDRLHEKMKRDAAKTFNSGVVFAVLGYLGLDIQLEKETDGVLLIPLVDSDNCDKTLRSVVTAAPRMLIGECQFASSLSLATVITPVDLADGAKRAPEVAVVSTSISDAAYVAASSATIVERRDGIGHAEWASECLSFANDYRQSRFGCLMDLIVLFIKSYRNDLRVLTDDDENESN